MCRQISLIIISLIVLMRLCNTTRAQSGCTMALVSLSPCLNYVSGNSSSAPSSSCCSRLSSLVQSQPQCLCALLTGGGSNFGIVVNQTLALALPGACRVQTPPVSQCDASNNNNGAANSGPAPADSPADAIPEDPNTPSDTDISPSGIGSKTFPGTDGSFVGGSNNNSNNGAKFSFLGFVFLLASSWAMYGTRF